MEPIQVLNVEDNPFVAEAVGRKISADPSFDWLGWVDNSDDLLRKVEGRRAGVVCMDLDMPGQNPFDMIRLLVDHHPGWRVLVLTGHGEAKNIDSAIDAGASGFLSKAEEPRLIVEAIRRVASGAFVLGELSRAVYGEFADELGIDEHESLPDTVASRSAIRRWLARGFRRLMQ